MNRAELLERIHQVELEILGEIDRICRENDLHYYLFYGTLIGAIRHQGFIPWDEDLDVAMPRQDYERFLQIAPRALGEKFMLDDISTNPLYFNPFAKVRNKDTLFAIRSLQNYKGNQGLWIDIFPLDTVRAKDQKIVAWRLALSHLIRAAIRGHRGIGNLTAASLHTRLLCKAIARLPDKMLWRWINRLHTSKNQDGGDCYVAYAEYPAARSVFPKALFQPARTGRFVGAEYPIPGESEQILTKIYGDFMQIPSKENQVTFYPEWIGFEEGQRFRVEEE